MKAGVQYNDFRGSVAADISDALSRYAGDTLKSIGRYFKLDEKRFEIIGLSIYGTDDFSISLLCVDIQKSNDTKEHIVSMMYDIGDDKENLDFFLNDFTLFYIKSLMKNILTLVIMKM